MSIMMSQKLALFVVVFMVVIYHGTGFKLRLHFPDPKESTFLGENATKNEFPWLVWFNVKLAQNETRFCTGSIIDLNLVLTTATCVIGYTESITVIAGDHFISEDDGTEQNVTSREITIHEGFNVTGHLENDIALIKLSSNLQQSSGVVEPIMLPNAECQGQELLCLVWLGLTAGWKGFNASEIEQDAVTSDDNLQLQKDVIAGFNCNATDLVFAPSAPYICTQFSDTYEGDMGSPLISSEDRNVVSALLSHKQIYELYYRPTPTAVYIKVWPHVGWILKNGGPSPPPTTTKPVTTTSGSLPSSRESFVLPVILLFIFKAITI